MASFYGWTKSQIDELEYSDFILFSQSINRLETIDHLRRLKEQDWTHMKESDRKKYWKSQYKIAYPDLNKKSGRILSTKELFEILQNR